jgi:Leucine-rich repeat (LRR) protein
VNYCPSITAEIACFQGLEIIIMNSNQIGDLETEKITKKLPSDTSKTLRLFSLMDNGLTRLPNINEFTNLTHLRLDNNNLTSENFSLALLNGKRLQTLTLSSCNLKNINPGALDGLYSNSLKIDLLIFHFLIQQ